MSVFQQVNADQWDKVKYLENYNNLHEGMAVGDVNGDQYPDIIANAWVLLNPGGRLGGEWEVENLDAKWNSQEGDHTLQVYDFDQDGDSDVLAGINRARAVNLEVDHFEFTRFDI